MDEIERIINLAKSFNESDFATIELKFSFSQESECNDFYSHIYHPESIDDLIKPFRLDDQYISGLRILTRLEIKQLNSLCSCYKCIALEYNGAPLKWSVRLKT